MSSDSPQFYPWRKLNIAPFSRNTSSMGPILVYHGVGLNVILDVYISFQPKKKNDACSSSSFYLFLVNTFCRTTFESGILKELWVDSNYLGISGELPLVISLYFTILHPNHSALFLKDSSYMHSLCIIYYFRIQNGSKHASIHPSFHASIHPIPFHALINNKLPPQACQPLQPIPNVKTRCRSALDMEAPNWRITPGVCVCVCAQFPPFYHPEI